MSDPDAVTLAYIHDHKPSQSWAESMVALVAFDACNHGRILRGDKLAMRTHPGELPVGRNAAVRSFLDDFSAPWLLWVDTDMGFPADSLERLLAVADPVERPVVGGLCFGWKEDRGDGAGGYRCHAMPTIYDWLRGEDGGGVFAPRTHYPANTLVRCHGTGSAFVLIHRQVLEGVRAAYGDAWYDRIPNPLNAGRRIGEDLSFCMRANALSVPIHVHTGVRVTHAKTFWLGEEDYLAQMVAPPADERVAVIVPAMRRPDNVARLVRSLRASTGLATVFFVCDGADKDEIAAVLAEQGGRSDVELLVVTEGSRPGTFAEKVNFAAGRVLPPGEYPWLFLAGDDVVFRPGWLDHAQHVARLYGADVVGTNDLANPRVMAGEHATHMLIRSSYVTSVGASWDGPGVVCHEGYGHWFVDDEIVTAARMRGVWQPALGSIVEHLHPITGRVEMDEVYELGQSKAGADRGRWEARLRRHQREMARAGVA